MSKRDGQQSAGVESGTSHKQKIDRGYLPRGESAKTHKPKPAPAEKAGSFKIK